MIKPQADAPDKAQAVTIHKANVADAKAIADLAQMLAAYEGVASRCDEAAIRSLIEGSGDPHCHILVAKKNDFLCGFVLYYPGYDLSSTSYGFHLADLCVWESMRGKGVGMLMMRAVAAHALHGGRDWVSLTVLEKNDAAQAFYDKAGFLPVDIAMRAIGKRGLQALVRGASAGAGE